MYSLNPHLLPSTSRIHYYTDSFKLHGTGTGTGRWWISILSYVLYTLHRERDRESLFSIVPIPFPAPVPVPMPCSLYKPLEGMLPKSTSVVLHKYGHSRLIHTERKRTRKWKKIKEKSEGIKENISNIKRKFSLFPVWTGPERYVHTYFDQFPEVSSDGFLFSWTK